MYYSIARSLWKQKPGLDKQTEKMFLFVEYDCTETWISSEHTLENEQMNKLFLIPFEPKQSQEFAKKYSLEKYFTDSL